MNLIHNEILQLSVIYWVLSLLMVMLTLPNRKAMGWLGVSSIGTMALAEWSMGMKWMFYASLVCMIASMSYSAVIFYRQSRECMRDIEKLNEEESSHGDERHLSE